uniref:Methylated-DNA--protein-cysteine methyltransferase n=1 Tax=Solibacter usitatus (strain Ellin6076) TaxID=234267 RepID=Q029M4_SOLUE
MIEWTEICLTDDLTVRLVTSKLGLRAINFRLSEPVEGERNDSNPIARETARQLAAYFDGRLRSFDLALDLQGTAFQTRVWRELERIPYGKTRSYLQIAEAIASPKAVRAVGAANGANPIPIVIPCHRVIGSTGRLVGYGGGLPLKKRLLTLEGALALDLRW